MSANSRKRYTVKELAKLSNVSVRTLRFYDEIGLLKPACYGENGYRYYEKEQLLLLQQILFYRELGFELAEIQKIVTSPNFDKAQALKSHRQQLVNEAKRTKELILTIDKTLAHLEKEAPMKEGDMYLGFDPKKQAQYEKEILERFGDKGQEKIDESKRRTKSWGKMDFDKVQKDYDELHKAFTAALNKGLAADAHDVQDLVKKHYAVVARFWTPDSQSYAGLGKMYCDHPDFRKLYDAYHPNLAEFMAQAMSAFAEAKLS